MVIGSALRPVAGFTVVLRTATAPLALVDAVRRTIGAFLVRHEDSWRMFH